MTEYIEKIGNFCIASADQIPLSIVDPRDIVYAQEGSVIIIMDHQPVYVDEPGCLIAD